LIAYFFKTAFWKRAFLVISTIPITIITNSLRIALTGILYEIWGPKFAEGFFHGFSGWFIFMFALSIMLLEMWALSGFKSFRTFGSSKATKEVLATDPHGPTQTLVKSSKGELPEATTNGAGQPQVAEGSTSQTTEDSGLRASNLKPPTSNWLRAFLSPPQFVVAVLLLGLTLVLSLGVEFREKIPIAKSFGQVPDQVGEWTGKSQAMEQLIIDTLDLSDYIMVNFSNGSGKWVNFYTAYYDSQRKGESIHSPATCLPGSGWEFKEGGSKKISIPGHKNGSIPVNRAFMIKSGYRQLSYYWFPQRDRILTNAYQLKLYNFWDALTRQRTDGALVRLITPVYDNEELADAEKRLQSFTQAIVPVLDEFLPK
jgi:EpsI family protein